MVGRARRATKAEKIHMDKVAKLPCLCCGLKGVEQPSITTVHHLLTGGKRRGHRYVLNLCEWHHYARPIVVQASSIVGHTEKWMTHQYGPSLVMGSKTFHEYWGSDQELLDKLECLLVS